MARRVNYLNNKDLLIEIHKSKCTYCKFLAPEYSGFDAICQVKEEITPEFIEEAIAKRADKLTKVKKAEAKEAGMKPPDVREILVPIEDIDPDEMIYRVMEFDHIPIDPARERRAKKPLDYHTKCNFPPFKHYIIKDGEFKEVGRSHWKDSFENGEFALGHGEMTKKLAKMFMMLVERYSQRGNWRGYTYLDEMKSQALFQLAQIALQFDESRSPVPNPFAYYTAAITNSFTRILNLEKKNQNIRDDILQMNGITPSYTRQIEHELSMDPRFKGQGQAPKKKWGGGRKKAVPVETTSEKTA